MTIREIKERLIRIESRIAALEARNMIGHFPLGTGYSQRGNWYRKHDHLRTPRFGYTRKQGPRY